MKRREKELIVDGKNTGTKLIVGTNSRSCRYLAWIPVALFLILAAVLYFVAGDRAQIGVADNLDLFQAQYQMLKNTGTFTAHGASAPFLHGISRDVLPGELSLEALLYALLPSLTAYLVMYFLKVILATVSFTLLALELEKRGLLFPQSGKMARREAGSGKGTAGNVMGKSEPEHAVIWNLAVLSGFAYGLLNLFPSFGISFASIPLLVWMVLRLMRADRKHAAGWLAGIFCYPLLSYFSYFGIFFLWYLLLAFLGKIIWEFFLIGRKKKAAFAKDGSWNHSGKKDVCFVKTRREKSSVGKSGMEEALRLLFALLVLALGYAVCEYRLFGQMLFGSETTIRDTMVQASLSGKEILQWVGRLLLHGVDMHAESAHQMVVLPVCLAYFVILNLGYLCRREWKKAATDLYNLCALILLFNSAVYGLYYLEPFRSAVETILPPLKGFQFSRTSFFNPFLWYGMFFLALLRLYAWLADRAGAIAPENQIGDMSGNRKQNQRNDVACKVEEPRESRRLGRVGGESRNVVWFFAGAAILAILLYNNSYNDLLHTAKSELKRTLGRQQEDSLSYGEFYSEELFQEACQEIGYSGEWSVAYGFHPAVLEYNGIATLDGYLGFYPESYKEEFRKVIAPALEVNEGARSYYDEWGARCYLYSPDQATIVEAVRNYPHPEDELAIAPEALRGLDCRYIFSRIRITNAEEMQLRLRLTKISEKSPYTLYVYELEDAGQK